MAPSKLIGTEKAYKGLYILIVRSSRGRPSATVFIHMQGQAVGGRCTCWEGQRGEFCEHLLKVILGRASLARPQDALKLQKIARAVDGTPLVRTLKRYMRAEREVTKAVRQAVATKLELNQYVLIEPDKEQV